MGAVGAPEARDRGVCLPAGLEQIVNAQAPVPGTEVGVVAAPGAAGIGEDEDAFLVVHEGLRLAEIGRGGAALDGEAVAARVGLAHDALRPAGDLGHLLGPDVPYALVECCLDPRSEQRHVGTECGRTWRSVGASSL